MQKQTPQTKAEARQHKQAQKREECNAERERLQAYKAERAAKEQAERIEKLSKLTK